VSTAAGQRKIGLIGLGLMGRPMGMNLLKAGHALTVWNRTPERAKELVTAGAKLAKTPREVAEASEVLLTIVSDPPALESVLWGREGRNDGALGGLKAGSTYIDSSTVSPVLAKRIAEACRERGVKFLDAPVTGGDWGAREGNLVFMIGGEGETLKEMKPILGVMGKKWFHLGPNGAGQTIKLAMNAILALQVGAMAEALALARQALFPDFFRPVWKYVGKLAIAEFDEARYRMDGPGCIAIDELLRDLHTAQVTRIRFEQFLVIEGQGLIAGKLEAFPMPDAVLDEFRCAQCRVATGSVMDRHCRSIVLCGDCATTIRKRGEGCPTCGQAPDFVTAHRS